ncbi:tRNA (adenosine(37)-N6)-threonylcarbamoyltransferase complex dimerization subunit type 1 TsaB [Leptothrix ochracea]|uniref:tRNA (adenosine(37)-N6)-threonylcarbamoyltransferase complex dimerization subunit type 1 TsaB n=1 Tax=Leptothrix ochracea TaxID=735331 RepID=UPI0034E2F66E
MTTRLLALDSSTETLHLALCVGEAVHRVTAPGGAQASTTLLPTVQRLLTDAGLSVRDLDAIAFGRGPGAFTGLRTACSVAQGLAAGADRPVLMLDTLALVAESARQRGGPLRVWVGLDARMHEVYAACWHWEAATGWVAEQSVALYTPGILAEHVAASGLGMVGNALLAYPEALAALGRPEGALAQPEGAALAALARAAWARGEGLDSALALPLYVRDKVAQTTAERTAQKVAPKGITP